MDAPRLPLRYYNSRLSNGLYLAFGLFLLSVGVAMLYHDEVGGGRWLVGLWLAGIAWQAGLTARRLFDRTPQLTLTQASVIDHRRWKRELFWADIIGARVWRFRGESAVCLEVADAEKYLRQLSPLQRRLALASVETKLDLLGLLPIRRRVNKCSKAFALDLSGLEADAKQVLATVHALVLQAKATNQPPASPS